MTYTAWAPDGKSVVTIAGPIGKTKLVDIECPGEKRQAPYWRKRAETTAQLVREQG